MGNAAVRILALPGLAAVAVCLALLCARPLVAALEGLLKKWRRMGLVPCVVAVIMAAVATVEVQKSGEREMDDFSRVERVEGGVDNLCFWGIEPVLHSVALGIAWPEWMTFVNDRIDIYGNYALKTNGWSHLAQVDVSQVLTNLVVEFHDVKTAPYSIMGMS